MLQINLYPGAGVELTPFVIENANKSNLDEAFELLAAQLIENNNKRYFLTVEEFDAMSENLSDFDKQCLDEQYLYIDGTMNGAKYPIYIDILNASIC